MKYIDAEKLKTKVKNLNLVTKTYDEQVAFNNALAMVVEIITSLQQEQPIIEEDWVEKRKQECWCRRLSDNGNYQCERYEGNFGPCDGQCSWIVDYSKLKELKEMKQIEVDLEKEDENCLQSASLKNHSVCKEDRLSYAYHFYEMGRKQVLQEIYNGKTKPVDKITAAWLND